MRRERTAGGQCRVEAKSETSKDIKEAQSHLDQNVLGQLRRGSLGLDSGLSGGLFSAAERPVLRKNSIRPLIPQFRAARIGRFAANG